MDGSAFIHTKAHPVALKAWFRHFYVEFPANRVDSFAYNFFHGKIQKFSRNFYLYKYKMRKFQNKKKKFCKKIISAGKNAKMLPKKIWKRNY